MTNVSRETIDLEALQSHKAIKKAGGCVLEHKTGSTWNDCGSWNTWIYYLPAHDIYLKVHQETDYRADLVVTRVTPRVTSKIEWDEWQN